MSTRALPLRLPWAWRWPLPAVGTWVAAWACFLALRPALGAAAASLAALALGGALAWPVAGRWRQALVVLGFPLSALATGAAAVPAWAWALALLALLGTYPLRAWGDAPVFPTPDGALDDLAASLALPAGAAVLDAGSGLGHGLRALHRAWPGVRVDGVEWSWPLVWWSRWRCPWAAVRRGDMWAGSWRAYDLVYLFQRPESMGRAWACAEMAPGRWLVSLSFDLPGVPPTLSLPAPGGHRLHAWRIPTQPGVAHADNPR